MTEVPDTPFLASEIDSIDLSRRQLRTLVREGSVRRVLTGVYVRSDLEDTQQLRARCAALVLPAHCVVSDRSAAWILGIDCYDIAELAVPPLLETVSIDGHDRTQRAELLGGKRALAPDEICEIEGVLVTTPLRTACDLACQRGRNRALAALDAFRRHYGLEVADFTVIVQRFVRRRGVIQLRELINYSNPLSESPGESWTRLTIIDEGLPPPQPQLWIRLDDHGWVRLDMGYEQLKICVEYDGEEFHSEDRDRARDDDRRAALRRAGWIVIVVRKDGFTGPVREAWVSQLKAAVAKRTPAPGKRLYSRGEATTNPWRRRTNPVS